MNNMKLSEVCVFFEWNLNLVPRVLSYSSLESCPVVELKGLLTLTPRSFQTLPLKLFYICFCLVQSVLILVSVVCESVLFTVRLA